MDTTFRIKLEEDKKSDLQNISSNDGSSVQPGGIYVIKPEMSDDEGHLVDQIKTEDENVNNNGYTMDWIKTDSEKHPDLRIELVTAKLLP